MRVVVRFADGADSDRELAQFIEFGMRRGARHKNRCRRNVHHTRRKANAQRVIAGTCGNDAARAFVHRHQRHPIQRAARLERTGDLPIFEFEKNLRADTLAQQK